MSIKRQQLVTDFVSAMHDGDAALFIGAGLSRSSGFVDWKGLLRDCALELGLDIDREHDLIAVTQYYLNRRNRDRARLNKILRAEFDKPAFFTRNHEIIGKLPISTIWTTNFDKLIEQAIEKAGRNVDVKSRDRQIAIPSKGKEVLLYKMHGDIASPDEVIICKDDYERYARKHEVFQNQLSADLVSKTFLFLGFSFTDPHLDYMLGHLPSLLEDSKREHFAVMRKVRFDMHIDEGEAKRRFDYEKNKQALQLEDLQRYSIQTHLIDSFNEVTDILESIERHYHLRSVFVSGSAHEFGDYGMDRMLGFCMQLGERLMDKEHRLISGMGLNIGDSVVKGALLRLYEKEKLEIEKHLTVRPFPRSLPSGVIEEEFNRKYRVDMISKCGFVIFIAGTSRSFTESVGVLQEYQIAKSLKKIPIPIGATGFAAQRIWAVMQPDIDTFYSGRVTRQMFSKLNDPSLSNNQLLDVVFEIIQRVSDI
jgi:SLOG family protein/SIR2-like protein